jgi:hypothetical protein
LRESHFTGQSRPLQFGQIDRHHHEVEIQRHAD